MTKLPTSVSFMGKTWKISEETMKKEFGKCYHRDLKITLRKNQPQDHLLDTVMHELVHMIDLEMAIGLKEKQVARLGTGLAHTLKTNPQLRRIFD